MNAQSLGVATLAAAAALYAIALIAYSVRLARVAEARGTDKALPARDRALGIARAAILVGAVLHAVGVIARGIEAGHVPWATMYEFTLIGSFAAVASFIVISRFRDIAFMGPGVAGVGALALGLGLPLLYQKAAPLQAALENYWLVIHVTVAALSTGLLVVAAVATGLQLARDYRASGSRFFGRRFWRRLEGMPEPSALEALAFRINAVGFVGWTFTVVAGAVWAEGAWGRFWGWDAKETGSFLVWVAYAAYLHARATRGWSGRRAAYLSLVGFGFLILNFTVVNLLLQGLHSYAK